MFENILFDLDGTLTDPGEGITNSVKYALNKRGITVSDKTKLYSFIGPPLKDSFEQYYGLSPDEALDAVDDFREYFRPQGIFENYLYDGIREMLESLKGKGKRLIIATSKPEEFAKQILERFDLLRYFDFVAGATMDSNRICKADVIRYALESCDICNLDTCIMIGDREHDVIGSAENGIKCIGVLWGYGNRDELLSAGCDYIAERVDDILTIIQ